MPCTYIMAESTNSADEIAAEDSNQANTANEMEASNTSQVPGNGGVSEIENSLANICLGQCSFCKGEKCNVGNKYQHWKGDILKCQDPKLTELQDPKYVEKCPLPPQFIKGTKQNRTINLSRMLENIPDVLEYIRETSNPYKELGNMLRRVERIGKPTKTIELLKNADEHAEQIDNMVTGLKDFIKDDKTFPSPYTNEIQKYPPSQADTSLSNIHFIDCEYLLKVSMPQQNSYSAFLSGKMFKPENHKTMEESKERDTFRWIFIPSSDRFDKDVILDRSHFQKEGIISRRDTLCFVVVRENQFDMYRERIGAKLPIIQLPENVIGVGYARFWIVKIAKRFKLQTIWMIDDSVGFFKEYFPTTDGNKFKKDPEAKDRTLNIRCPEYCFHKMESIMDKQPSLVAVSPRKYRSTVNVTYEFSCKPIQSVMLLNISKLTEKNLNFRPELRYMEDMVFSKECTNAGLELCTVNSILFVDKPFETTGANTTCQSPRRKTQTREKIEQGS